MLRDFSESARQELLSLVSQVEDEQWCGVTDWLGDCWLGFEDWLGNLDINKYLDNVGEYHKKVIDKNNATAGDIDAIFEAVNTQSTNYRGRFLAQLTDLRLFTQTIQALSDTVAPGKNNFNPQYIGGGLKSTVEGYLNSSQVLQQIAGDGLTGEELDEITDEDQLRNLLDAMARTFLTAVPDIGIGDKAEIPVGPNLTFYYQVEASGDLGENVDVNLVIEEQRAKFDSFSVTIAKIGEDGEIGLDISEDGVGISAGNGKNEIDISLDAAGVVGVTTSVTDGDHTYSIMMGTSVDTVVVEESIETAVGNGSITATIGLERKDRDEDGNGLSWAPVPAYAPVAVPYPGTLPQIDWDGVIATGKIVGGTVLVVAGVVYLIITYGDPSVIQQGWLYLQQAVQMLSYTGA